ncbi:hypothetical protein [Pseudomonas sp. NBRC 111139]|uniref:hypothetical protein n=1 Tax=Pseudomonas sp. NBRC 111139 TaxID=1661054 RepID=UPI001112DAC1|nr:hypothetical protein [Pseudomonas sp. NBRC 111139]
MSRLPEGIRRVCIVTGTVLVLVMLFTMRYTLRDWLEMPWDQAAFTAAILIGFFLCPFIVCRVAFWIKDGFAKSGA